MKLEEQVCSQKLAEKLETLGVNQDSLFYWCDYRHYVEGQLTTDWFLKTQAQAESEVGIVLSAFTVAELGKMLPNTLLLGDTHMQQFTERFHDKWLVGYPTIRDDDTNFSDTEADARAAALIYLLENKLITL